MSFCGGFFRNWQGGKRVRDEKATGSRSLKIVDNDSKSDVAAHAGNLLTVEEAKGDEQLVYDPKVKGVYDVYVGFMLSTQPAHISIRLQGETTWTPIETTVYLEEFKTSPDVAQPKHHFQLVHWKEADLTGRRIEILPKAGSTVNLDCFQFIICQNS